MPEKQKHSAETMTHALDRLAANGGNVKKTAAELGLARSVLTSWRDGTRRRSEAAAAIVGNAPADVTVDLTPEDGARYAELAGKWQNLANLAVDEATVRVKEAKPKELAIIAAVSTDKALLLSGRPTSRTEERHIVYVAPNALRELAGQVIEGSYTEGLTISLPEPTDDGEAALS